MTTLALPAGLHSDTLAAAAIVERGWPIGPRPLPCVCGVELARHLAALPAGCSGYVHDPIDALAVAAVESADRQVMDDIVDAGDEGYVPSGATGPRVSDYGGCGRAVWYRETPKPAGYVVAHVDWRRAALGRIIHKAAEVVRAARYPWRLYEFEIAVPGLDKKGKVDEYDPVLGEVTDDKTAGDAKWAMVGDDGPTADSWGQALIYGFALEQAGWPVKTVRIIVIHRESGKEEHFRRDYDPGEARDALDELVALAMTLDMGVVPPRAGDGPGAFPCSWCEHRIDCWQMLAAKAAGRSPESYTVLGPDPEDGVIEWAARQAFDARRAATAADKKKKAAAALLEGVKGGVYGEFEVIPRRREMPDYKGATDRANDLLALPPHLRPRNGEVTVPKRVDKWTEAAPLRKATRDRLAKMAREGQLPE